MQNITTEIQPQPLPEENLIHLGKTSLPKLPQSFSRKLVQQISDRPILWERAPCFRGLLQLTYLPAKKDGTNMPQHSPKKPILDLNMLTI